MNISRVRGSRPDVIDITGETDSELVRFLRAKSLLQSPMSWSEDDWVKAWDYLGHFDHSGVGEAPFVMKFSTIACSYEVQADSQLIFLQRVARTVQKSEGLEN